MKGLPCGSYPDGERSPRLRPRGSFPPSPVSGIGSWTSVSAAMAPSVCTLRFAGEDPRASAFVPVRRLTTLGARFCRFRTEIVSRHDGNDRAHDDRHRPDVLAIHERAAQLRRRIVDRERSLTAASLVRVPAPNTGERARAGAFRGPSP